MKAAGGVRTLDMALSLREAGATRLGCSKNVPKSWKSSAARQVNQA